MYRQMQDSIQTKQFSGYFKNFSDNFEVRNYNLATLNITTLKTTKKKTNVVTSLHTSCMYDNLGQYKTWNNLLSESLPLHGPVSF